MSICTHTCGHHDCWIESDNYFSPEHFMCCDLFHTFLCTFLYEIFNKVKIDATIVSKRYIVLEDQMM